MKNCGQIIPESTIDGNGKNDCATSGFVQLEKPTVRSLQDH